jgi:hypothetical protein
MFNCFDYEFYYLFVKIFSSIFISPQKLSFYILLVISIFFLNYKFPFFKKSGDFFGEELKKKMIFFFFSPFFFLKKKKKKFPFIIIIL